MKKVSLSSTMGPGVSINVLGATPIACELP
jgi:hypothetical protein